MSIGKAARHVFYLHGFASSPKSTKAAYFAERLRRHGVASHCPDFNEPEFASLTITRMLDQLALACRPLKDEAIALVGSSLGGTLAVLAAERFGPSVERLVLLAPAVMFARPGHHLLSPERIEEWRRKGAIPFFHYGYGEERLLNFSLYEDTQRYDPFAAKFSQPALIFQGLRDQSVDHRDVEEFARPRSNVILSLLDDDHQLQASLPAIWDETEAFLGLVQ